jgi:serine/threonine protein kinase
MTNNGTGSLEKDLRLAEVLDSYLAAVRAGTAPEADALLAEHPELAGDLRECLASLRFLRHAPRAPALSPGDGDIPAEGPLGDFRLVREIGRGGMGVVYEAVQISLGRRVALKVLPFAAALDARQLQRFKNEAQAAAFLHHQNIVPVYAVGQERGVHYYAMQFIEGRTLSALIAERQRLTRGKAARAEPGSTQSAAAGADPSGQATAPHLPASAPILVPPLEDTPPRGAVSTEGSAPDPAFFRTAARLGMQAAGALEHAHQRGVIHRDIKPANLMVEAYAPLSPGGRGAGGEWARLWIADFGLAHCHSQSGPTLTGDLVGTLRYMSPEQALAKRVPIDHRTDIYSLGATFTSC